MTSLADVSKWTSSRHGWMKKKKKRPSIYSNISTDGSKFCRRCRECFDLCDVRNPRCFNVVLLGRTLWQRLSRQVTETKNCWKTFGLNSFPHFSSGYGAEKQGSQNNSWIFLNCYGGNRWDIMRVMSFLWFLLLLYLLSSDEH